MGFADVQAMKALKLAKDAQASLVLNQAVGQTVTKDFTQFLSTGTYKLYIPNVPLQSGYLKIHYKAPIAETATFYIFSQSGFSFFVLKAITVNLVAGTNVIDTGYICAGDGTEFVGFYAHNYYKLTGGTGMYEATGVILTAGQSVATTQVPAAATYDFGFYYEYVSSSQPLASAVAQLRTSVNALNNSVLSTNTASIITPTAKDFTQYTSTGTYKMYIPNVPLSAGYLKAHFKGVQSETVPFFILTKSGATFTVVKVITVAIIVGDNLIDTGYTSKGDGTEYFGFFAHNYFKQTGGTGMYEMTGATLTQGQVITPQDSTTGAAALFDFATYFTYTNIGIRSTVAALQTTVANLQAPTDSSIKLSDFQLPRYSELSGQSIGYVGRWFDKTISSTPCKVTINEGSEFYFKVKGTVNIAVNFLLITSLATPNFAYSIDGAPLTRQLITNPNLPTVDTGEHIVRIVCDGLTEGENKWVGEIGFAVSGVTVDAGATLIGVIPKNRTLIFFGDSITEGIRVLGMNADSTNNSGSGAYPYTTCADLNAISYRVGFGATGVTKSGSGGVPACLQYIDNMTSTRPAPYAEPDAIVINHGTNDSGADSATFTAAYNAVLNRLKVKYAGVPIFTMIPFNQTHAQDIRNCVSDKPFCHLVETNGWGVTFTDGTHPDVNGGITAGTQLSAAIQAVLGKNYFVH